MDEPCRLDPRRSRGGSHDMPAWRRQLGLKCTVTRLPGLLLPCRSSQRNLPTMGTAASKRDATARAQELSTATSHSSGALGLVSPAGDGMLHVRTQESAA